MLRKPIVYTLIVALTVPTAPLAAAPVMDESAFTARAAVVARDVACGNHGNFDVERNSAGRDKNENLVFNLVAKIQQVKSGQDCPDGGFTRTVLTTQINDVIGAWNASSQVGTDPIPCPNLLNPFPDNGGLFMPEQPGDYDVALRGLVWIAYSFPPRADGVGLTKPNYSHLRDQLLIVDGTSTHPPRTEQYRYGVAECGNKEHSTGSPSDRADEYNAYLEACKANGGGDCTNGWPEPDSGDDSQEEGCLSDFWSAIGCGLLGLLAFALGAIYPPVAAAALAALINDNPEVGVPLALAPIVLPLGPFGWAVAGGLAATGVAGNELFQVPETENHILMIETSRFLTNNLMRRDYECTDPAIQGLVCSRDDYHGYTMRFDNTANRTAEWMLRYLQEFLKRDFIEFNSRPYQRYAQHAIQNLYDLACAFDCTGDNLKVKVAAKAVLDYLSAKMAVASSSDRRLAPFRRRAEYKNTEADFDWLIYRDKIDYNTKRFALFSDPSILPGDGGCPGADSKAVCDGLLASSWIELLIAGAGTYRVPDMLYPIAHVAPTEVVTSVTGIPAGPLRFLQWFHHAGAEAYYHGPGFLISAGGVKTKLAYYMQGQGDDEQDVGVVVPTVLMPYGWGAKWDQFIRFEAAPGRNGDNNPNLCVTYNFACGVEMKIPAVYTATPGCSTTQGKWTFIDMSCVPEIKQPFYVAAYMDDCPAGSGCRNQGATNFGFFETYEKRKDENGRDVSLAAFQSHVIARNGSKTFAADSPNGYDFEVGKANFTPTAGRIDGDPFSGWRLAQGDIVNANGDGCVILRNPQLEVTRILSLTDYNTPYILEQRGDVKEPEQFCNRRGTTEQSLR